MDPVPGPSTLNQAMREGITLKYHPDFLLYMATVTGSYAMRHIMIPCLIDSLAQLAPSDCILQACTAASEKVKRDVKQFGPTLRQLPKFESTLSRKFCIGKLFPPIKRSAKWTDTSNGE